MKKNDYVGRSPAPRSQVLVQSLAFGSLLHCGLVRYPSQRGVPPQHSRFIPREFAGTLLRTNSIVSVSERTTLPVSILNYSKIRFLEFNLYLNTLFISILFIAAPEICQIIKIINYAVNGQNKVVGFAIGLTVLCETL